MRCEKKKQMRIRKTVSVLLTGSGLALLAACGGGTKDEAAPAIKAQVTFNEDIAPIIFANCSPCHHTDQVGHIDLMTYQQVKEKAQSIVFVTKSRKMPPWPADPHYMEYAGQKILSNEEIAMLEQWTKNGCPEGDAAQAPKPPVFAKGSMLGVPDLQLKVQPIFLKGDGKDRFLMVKVPWEIDRDTFIHAIEFVPGNTKVVHHVNGDMVQYQDGMKKNVFEGEHVADLINDPTVVKIYEKMKLPNDDGSYPILTRSAVNYLPGVIAQIYPEGIGGYNIKRKGAFLFNDIHYGGYEKDIWDSSYVNVFFSPAPPKRPVKEFQLGTLGVSPIEPALVIQPNEVKTFITRYTVPDDISILTVNPHMHLLGQTFKAYALKPGGDTIRLISIPKWDFNWQYFYTFKKMVHVPKGSTIVAEGLFDNTRNNPYNPFNPPQVVAEREGSMRTTDEMFQLIITYLPYQAGDENISLETKK